MGGNNIRAPLTSLELVAMEGKAAPSPRYGLAFEALLQETARPRPYRTPPLWPQECHAALRSRVASPRECCMLCVNQFAPISELTGVFDRVFASGASKYAFTTLSHTLCRLLLVASKDHWLR